MKKNLITGATGIVGSHVLFALLKNNQEVIACKQNDSDVKKVLLLFSCYTNHFQSLFDRIRWIDIDLNDLFSLEEAFEGIDHVYHCAGFVSFNRVDRKKLFEINTVGTKNVVNACLSKKVEALCFVSSMSTLHNLDVKEPITESIFWKSSGKESDYALSKYRAELEVWRGIEEGLNAVIVNPGVILSPVFWEQSSAKIFATCYKGNLFYPPGNSAYVAALDVANCMIQLLERKIFKQRFILIEGNYSYQSILSMIQTNFKRRAPIIRANKALLTLAWMAQSFIGFLHGKPPKITKSLIHSALNKQTYSNQKIVEVLQYTFVTSPKAIESICEFYIKNQRSI
jgi:nucleoside-diphosphate-sugar epimerase